ncbi:MAG TPA: hypothetical protein VFQ53_43220 [Kofleriaceae bacterium]|nr:hypothetical protein [Kofleriaceae bacterium]
MRSAGAVIVVAVLASVAHAEGERSPMIGGALVATHAEEHDDDIGGVELEATWWWHRLGVALEGSRRWDLATGDVATSTVGASARVLVYDCLVPSLFEPRDVELGIELHGIVERAWWGDRSGDQQANHYGFGVAIRLRGGGDAWFSTLLAESRLFVRVLAARADAPDMTLARTTMPAMLDGERSVIVGLGAAWGVGHAAYADKFRYRWPDPFAEH